MRLKWISFQNVLFFFIVPVFIPISFFVKLDKILSVHLEQKKNKTLEYARHIFKDRKRWGGWLYQTLCSIIGHVIFVFSGTGYRGKAWIMPRRGWAWRFLPVPHPLYQPWFMPKSSPREQVFIITLLSKLPWKYGINFVVILSWTFFPCVTHFEKSLFSAFVSWWCFLFVGLLGYQVFFWSVHSEYICLLWTALIEIWPSKKSLFSLLTNPEFC